MEEVEALGIILNMISRAYTTDWELAVSDDLAAKEAEARDVLFKMWIARGGRLLGNKR